MSHFCTAVVLDTEDENEVYYLLENELMPYLENNMNQCPEEFLEFRDCTDDIEYEYEKVKDVYPTIKEFALSEGYEWDDELNGGGFYVNPNSRIDRWKLCDKDNLEAYEINDCPKGYCKIKDYKKSNSDISAIVYNGEWIDEDDMLYDYNYDYLKTHDAFLNKFNEILDDPANQEKYIAFVDCHI